MEELWTTAVTKVEPNKLSVRGYLLADVIGRLTFTEMIFLIIRGELPRPEESQVMDAILVSSIDHGVTPPSTLAARTVASTGAPLNAALATGILSINRHHGGAVEDCMKLLLKGVADKKTAGQSADVTASEIVRDYREQKKRLAGYGHRVHTLDPRTVRLLEIAKAAGVAGEYVEMSLAIQDAIQKETGKKLPLNVDGAVAALLCELGFPSALANAVFIIARVPGLTAHVFEEMTEQKPMRRISPTEHGYSGAENRVME